MFGTPLHRSRTKLALLAFGWVVWFFIFGSQLSVRAEDGTPQPPEQSCPGCETDSAIGSALSNPAPSGSGDTARPNSAAGNTGTQSSDTTARPNSAAGNTGTQSSDATARPGSAVNSGTNGGGSGQTVTLKNPLSNITSIPDLLNALLRVFIILVLPIIIFFIILAGFNFVTAQGDPGKLTKAKDALLYAVIGAVLIMGATAITTILANLVKSFTN